MDKITSEQRSLNMKKIRSKNTAPEVYFRKLLFNKGFRYRLHTQKIIGKPDLYLKKYNTAIFINGCFWHQHKNCRYARIPKSRPEYWIPKLERNVRRDEDVKKSLREQGIRQVVIWECALKEMKKDQEIETENLDKIIEFLKKEDDQFLEISGGSKFS